MEQILYPQGFSEETVTDIMKLNKPMVRSPDGDSDFFDTVAGDPICTISIFDLARGNTSNVNRSNERKWFQSWRNYYGCRLH